MIKCDKSNLAELTIIEDFIRLVELANIESDDYSRKFYLIRIDNDLKLIWYSKIIDLQTKRLLARRLNKMFDTDYFI